MYLIDIFVYSQRIKPLSIMIYTITFTILCLVALNFLLLKFSCNTTSINKKVNKKPIVLSTRVTSLPDSQELAPTGS